MKARFPGFKGFEIGRNLRLGQAWPVRPRPEINDLPDLVSFCRNSRHQAMRAFGILIDPRSSKAELSLISAARSLKVFQADVVSVFMDKELMIKKAKLFSLAEALDMVRSDNYILANIGIHHPEISVADFISVLDTMPDNRNFDEEFSVRDSVCFGIQQKLRDFDIEPKILEQLAAKGGYWRDGVVAGHPNTPVHLLIAMQHPNYHENLRYHARENLLARGIISAGSDQAEKKDHFADSPPIADVISSAWEDVPKDGRTDILSDKSLEDDDFFDPNQVFEEVFSNNFHEALRAADCLYAGFADVLNIGIAIAKMELL